MREGYKFRVEHIIFEIPMGHLSGDNSVSSEYRIREVIRVIKFEYNKRR